MLEKTKHFSNGSTRQIKRGTKMPGKPGDKDIIRRLADQVAAIASHPRYAELSSLWAGHNSLRRYVRPLILSQCFATDDDEFISCECTDPLFQEIEKQLRITICRHLLDDDSIIKPWIAIRPKFLKAGWGIESVLTHSTLGKSGAYKLAAEPAIALGEPLPGRLRMPIHLIDDKSTRLRVEKAREAVGDILPVLEDRTTWCSGFGQDISYMLGQLLGLDRLMLLMYDNPGWLHELAAFLRDGILSVHEQAESSGDFTSLSQHNQAELYAYEIAPPSSDGMSVKRKRLWGFFASQEFTGVSPSKHEEFLLRYQLPIMENFGLVAYGCCENLTDKIDMLRQIKNLRRIAVSPWADLSACAGQIRDRYVLSWRPSPAQMVCTGFDAGGIEKALREGLRICAGCRVDIMLKDVHTLQGERGRIAKWVRIAKDIAEEYGN